MIEDKELISMLYQTIAKDGLKIGNVALDLGVVRETVSRWRQTERLSRENRETIAAWLAGRGIDLSDDSSKKWPVVDDPLLAEINSVWDRLSKSERGDVYRYVFATLEKSGCGVQPKNVVNGD